LTHFKN
jgi:hypothetical protein